MTDDQCKMVFSPGKNVEKEVLTILSTSYHGWDMPTKVARPPSYLHSESTIEMTTRQPRQSEGAQFHPITDFMVSPHHLQVCSSVVRHAESAAMSHTKPPQPIAPHSLPPRRTPLPTPHLSLRSKRRLSLPLPLPRTPRTLLLTLLALCLSYHLYICTAHLLHLHRHFQSSIATVTAQVASSTFFGTVVSPHRGMKAGTERGLRRLMMDRQGEFVSVDYGTDRGRGRRGTRRMKGAEGAQDAGILRMGKGEDDDNGDAGGVDMWQGVQLRDERDEQKSKRPRERDETVMWRIVGPILLSVEHDAVGIA